MTDETRNAIRLNSPPDRLRQRSDERFVRGLLIGLLAFLAPAKVVLADQAIRRPEVRFEHLLPEDGLSDVTVYSLVQDRTGFLWIATENGLNRFDGYAFEVFRHDPNVMSSLASDDISYLLQDAEGLLWLATWGGGLDRFDPVAGSFQHFGSDATRGDRLQDDRIQHLFEDSTGVLWVGTFAGGLARLDPDHDDSTSGTFVTYRHDPEDPSSLCHDRVWNILEDAAGAFWVATHHGLCLFDRASGTFERFLHRPGDPTSLSDDVVRTLYVDSGGVLWVGTARGLNRYSNSSRTFERFLAGPNLSHDAINAVFEDSLGTLWIGTSGGGLNAFDRTSGTWRTYRHDPEVPSSLSDDDVRAFLEDRSGVLWIATRQGGLDKLDLKPAKFVNGGGWSPGAGKPRVRAFAEDPQDRLWIATDEGLELHVGTGGTPERFRRGDGGAPSLPSNDVRHLLIDSTGVLWIAAGSSGLHGLRSDGTRFITYQHDEAAPESLADDLVTALAEDRAGGLWVGTASGLDRLDRHSGAFEHFRLQPTDPTSLSEDFVTTIFQDLAGVLWIGTYNRGLNRLLDTSDREFLRFRNNPTDPQSLSNNRVTAIHQQSSGMLWIGTANGLNEMRSDGTFRRLLIKDGLPNTRITGIVDDDAGRLWLATGRGLSRFDPRTGTFRNYTARDGLPGDQFNLGAALRRRDGRLCFGSNRGYSCFDPERVADNPHAPPVVLTGFRKFGEDASLGRAAWAVDDIRLSHRDNFFSFEFAALDYTRPEDNHYRYRLEDFDRDWSEAGSRRSASYTNVSPGDYVFRVQGSNSDRVWNEEGLSVTVSITPPYWQTAWFRALAAAILATVVGGAFSARVRHLKRREHKLARRVDEASADLRRSEKRYRLLFERNLAGVVRATVDGRILDCNDAFARILGYGSPGQCRESHVLDFGVSLNDRPSLADRLHSDGAVVSYESSARSREGSPVALLWNASLVPGDGGGPPVVEATTIDVSERRRVEEGLRRAQKLESLGVLAGGIAHDFNNLLMSIMGNAEMARRDLDTKSPIHRRLDRIETASGNAAELAKQMLAFSGKGDFVVSRLDFSAAVREMKHLLDGAASKNARMIYQLDPDLPAIEADARNIEQIVMSLVTNASESLDTADGVITVRTGSRDYTPDDLAATYLDDRLPAGRYVFFEVVDQGCGMDEDLQANIFDPFFTTKFTGRGLGLAAVLGIVRGHRGAIKFDSAPGCGSTFTVLFPAATPYPEQPGLEPPEPEPPEPEPPEPEPEPTTDKPRPDSPPEGGRARTSRGTVLVVDDDKSVRQVARDMLSAIGFDVLTASDGQEGVEVFRRRASEIVLVVLDLSMPRMSGEEAFIEIRKTAPGTRVILASGYDEKECTRRFAGRELSGFIQKPYRLTSLEEKIRDVLEDAEPAPPTGTTSTTVS